MVPKINSVCFASKFKIHKHSNEPMSKQILLESFCDDNLITYKKEVSQDEIVTSFEVKDDFDYTVERLLYFNDINYSKEKKFDF